MPEIRLIGLSGLPEIQPGDRLGAILAEVATFETNDVLVVAQKIVSKAEGRLVRLSDVSVSRQAEELARQAEKDPRLVQLILDESRAILRVRPGLIIVEDRRGWVCANAGIDRSNVAADGEQIVSLLPLDPDRSAAHLRAELMQLTGVELGVIISDSHGRAWREGTVGVAIGAAGIVALTDRRGQRDRHGYQLQHTLVGTADELAAAASLLMGQAAESVPAVIVRGLDVHGCGQAHDLQRPHQRDLFR
jgi:coenzyme F420-0:L-glutamate ligase/coenzyme F420-1:gamma-L-glutamate ligase